ncbi:nuclear transport factor 2 family protein [Gordonia sp. LSe1-13]|uniref:Nuclear transport factor 2 family protein n=1 Tax=Gordonia sesuvii TaxID=3116777 RepID=A0ABU7M968_9ACTN|nr:nuclear transport factor 2 family protein [Gordonia sp. LSe1-13]
MSTVSVEISNALARIAYAADFGSMQEYADLLTDDVVWVLPDAPAVSLPAQERKGIEAVLAGARERRESGLQGPGTASMHVVTNISVSPGENEDEALSTAYWHFLTGLGKVPKLVQSGTYHDRFVFERGAWLLAHRTIGVVR